MPRFDLYEKRAGAARRARPWNPLRVFIWMLLFVSLALWLYSLWRR
ncbi:hypothetical protein [Phenylobacterium sp.]